MHPEDAAAHGLADGLGARVRTAAGEAVLPVRVTDHIAQGTVFVPFNQPGLAANTLLSGSWTTPVEVEATDSPEPDTAESAEPATLGSEAP
jgi:assimilatory nitrate reductase catalytic subunit